jgi:hypothetical protein
VLVQFFNDSGNQVFCSTGTLLVDSTDPGARRTSPLTYAAGTIPSFPYYPFVPGRHTISVRQIEGTTAPDGSALKGSGELDVQPNSNPNQFWVAPAATPVNSPDGSFTNPFPDVSTALQTIPGQLVNPCIRVRAGVYTDRPVISRRATVIGDSIAQTVFDGRGQGDALSAAPGADGTTIRRFTLIGATDNSDPLLSGLLIYGSSVRVSNLVVRANNNGVRIEESRGGGGPSTLTNCTIVSNSKDAVYSSLASAAISSSIIRLNVPCDVFEGYSEPGQGLAFSFTNFTRIPTCQDLDPGSQATTDAPDLLDSRNWILDILSSRNKAIRIVDGGDYPAVGLDVDRTLPDRGAYGGPWGEVHYSVILPSGSRWPVMATALLSALAVLLVLRRRDRRAGTRKGWLNLRD